eukprot:s176_g2.t1
MTNTPPYVSDQESSDDLGPVTIAHGAFQRYPGSRLVQDILMDVLNIDYTTPGLVRVVDSSNDPVEFNASVRSLTFPRALVVQIASHHQYRVSKQLYLNLTHCEDVSLQEQVESDAYQLRLRILFISPFRAIDFYERLLGMFSTVTNNLERRVQRLEHAGTTGEPLILTPRAAADWSHWTWAPQDSAQPEHTPSPNADADVTPDTGAPDHGAAPETSSPAVVLTTPTAQTFLHPLPDTVHEEPELEEY